MKIALPSRTIPLAAVVALCLSGSAWAQDTSAETAPAAAPTDLSVGSPVAEAEDGPGSTYIAETHGDWEIRCIRVEEGQQEPCQMYQLLADEEGSPVAEFNIFDIPDQGELAAGATIVTPLDTLLTPQLRLSIDSAQARQYPFSFCQRIGCFVRIGLTEADLNAFRNGAAANVAIVPLPAPDQVVTLNASLTGFTAAFEGLSARTAAQPAAEEAEPAD